MCREELVPILALPHLAAAAQPSTQAVQSNDMFGAPCCANASPMEHELVKFAAMLLGCSFYSSFYVRCRVYPNQY
jgi:hypothetical protein